MRTKIIILNGTSSAGKSTLASHLRKKLPADFCFYSSDQLADAGFRPIDPITRESTRNNFFQGFHMSIATFAQANNHLLVEHIIEQPEWFNELNTILAPFDVFWVGVFAPLEVLKQREKKRGNRTTGEAKFHLKTHGFCHYDCEVDTSDSIEDCTNKIIRAWNYRFRNIHD
nr:AAA family ATPase [Acinetobacter sp. Marseille-Q1620]